VTPLDLRQPVDPALVGRVRLDEHRSQQAFRAMLDALARPGTIVPLAVGVLDDEVPGPLLLPLALADASVRVDVIGPGSDRWLEVVLAATGARRCPLEAADLVAGLGPVRAQEVRSLRRGRPEAPEEGARLALGCHRLHPDPATRAELTVELRGPGVPGSVHLGVDGLAPGVLGALSEVNHAFPVGIDTWLVSDDRQLVGLPRSVRFDVGGGR
jgi:alpha-D-ribose 1-methylphosphonate 5-triphosphate synthase subunit PhnH